MYMYTYLVDMNQIYQNHCNVPLIRESAVSDSQGTASTARIKCWSDLTNPRDLFLIRAGVLSRPSVIPVVTIVTNIDMVTMWVPPEKSNYFWLIWLLLLSTIPVHACIYSHCCFSSRSQFLYYYILYIPLSSLCLSVHLCSLYFTCIHVVNFCSYFVYLYASDGLPANWFSTSVPSQFTCVL